MSAHVSVFELKRFAEDRFAPEELPAFERHLAVCAECAGRLQKAATRELHARGLGGLLAEAPVRSAPAAATLIAFAASVLVVLSLGRTPLKFPEPSSVRAFVSLQQHGPPPLAVDAGMALDGTIAFYDGGGEQP